MIGADFFSCVLDTISVAWMELAMFALAFLVYLAFVTKKQEAKTVVDLLAKPGKSSHQPAQDAVQSTNQALRSGHLGEALDFVAQVGPAGGIIPWSIAARVLSALSQARTLDSEVEAKAKAMAGRFDSRALEAAATEAGRRGDTAGSRQLCRLSGLMSIPASQRALELILRGLASDAAALRAVVEEVIAENPEGLSKSLAEAALASCAVSRDADLAASIFEKACSASGAPPHPALCVALIKVYVACEKFDDACVIYEEIMAPARMKVEGPFAEFLMKAAVQCGRSELAEVLFEFGSGDAGKHAKSISACGKEGNLPGALAIFDKLKQGGLHLNSVIYNCLLDACVQCSDMTSALKHFEEMKALGLADIVSHNTIMKGYFASGDMEAANLLLSQMPEAGLKANRITYHGLLNALVQRHDRYGAWRLVDQMLDAGLTPNSVTCSILLKAFTTSAHKADVERVMSLIDTMETPMDEVLFAAVVEGCINTGRLDLLSDKTRNYAQQAGRLKLTAPTYGSMIKAYGQVHDTTRVWELWEEMAARQVRPTAITFGCMVEALVVNQRTDDAWKLVQKMWSDDLQKSSVNTVIYSTILKGLAMSRQPDKVMELYDEMRARSIPVNTITYNTMLNAFARCGAMDRVPKLLEDMRAAEPRVDPDVVTYSTIMKGYCMSGDVDTGLKLLDEMKADGKYTPDEVMFNSLLDGCAKQHRLADALRLLDEMRAAAVAPSNYTLSIMVKLLGRSRRLNQAFSMVNDVSKEFYVRPNIQVYTCLIQACFHNRQLQRALALHDEFVSEGNCAPDEKTYTALARGCLQANSPEKAAEVIRCAYHLPGHHMVQSKGAPCGVESRCLDEVLSKLGSGSSIAKELQANLQAHRGLGSSGPRVGETAPWRRGAGGRGNARDDNGGAVCRERGAR